MALLEKHLNALAAWLPDEAPDDGSGAGVGGGSASSPTKSKTKKSRVGLTAQQLVEQEEAEKAAEAEAEGRDANGKLVAAKVPLKPFFGDSALFRSRLLPLVMEALSFGTASFDGDWRRLAMKKRKPAKGTAGWWSDQLAKEKRKAAKREAKEKEKARQAQVQRLEAAGHLADTAMGQQMLQQELEAQAKAEAALRIHNSVVAALRARPRGEPSSDGGS